MRRRIWVRSICEIPEDEDQKSSQFEMINRAVRAGEEATVMKELPVGMVLLDRKTIMFALTDPVSKRTSLTSQVVEHRDLAQSSKTLFEILWERAKDYHILKD